jgi:hypothetical protein
MNDLAGGKAVARKAALQCGSMGAYNVTRRPRTTRLYYRVQRGSTTAYNAALL